MTTTNQSSHMLVIKNNVVKEKKSKVFQMINFATFKNKNDLLQSETSKTKMFQK